MKIEERLLRRELEDIVEIGQLLEKFYNSASGTIVRAIIQGLLTSEAQGHWDDHKISGDRILGRIEGINMVREKIEIGIQEMKLKTERLPEEGENG